MNVNKNQSKTPIVIGIDHGYGNIKTASSCFRTSVKAYDTEPTFTSNMLAFVKNAVDHKVGLFVRILEGVASEHRAQSVVGRVDHRTA